MEYRQKTYTEEGDLIQIKTRTATSREDRLEAEQHQFIVAHWPHLAAASYQGFQRFGIGAVVVEERPSQAAGVAHPFEAHHVGYAPQVSRWTQQALPAPHVQWLDDLFQTYDPREVAVLVFLQPRHKPRVYLVSATLSPKQALQRMSPPLN